MAPNKVLPKAPANGPLKKANDKVIKKQAKKPTAEEIVAKEAQKKADATAKAKKKADKLAHTLRVDLDTAHSRLRNVQTFYPNVPTPTTYRFRQHNPLNKKDARCLIYAFARGYYGPPNTAKCHKRADHILRRMAHLWDHVKAAGPATQARVDRRRIYERMMLSCEDGEFQDQMDDGEWGTMEMVQMLADAFDVEILIWSPNNLTRAKPLDPPQPHEWTLQARGSRHAPERQINIVNYQYLGHWCLLVPIPQSATPIVINGQDPHMISTLMSPEELRTPTPTDAPPHTVPVSLLRHPSGNPVYNSNNVVEKDRFHIADLDTVVPGTNAFPAMHVTKSDSEGGEEGGDDKDQDKGKISGKQPTHKELVAAAEAELAAATKARIAAVEREKTAVANLAKLKGPVINLDSDDDAEDDAQDKKDAKDAQDKKDAQALAAAAKMLQKGKKTDQKGAKTSSKNPVSAVPSKTSAKGSKKPAPK